MFVVVHQSWMHRGRIHSSSGVLHAVSGRFHDARSHTVALHRGGGVIEFWGAVQAELSGDPLSESTSKLNDAARRCALDRHEESNLIRLRRQCLAAEITTLHTICPTTEGSAQEQELLFVLLKDLSWMLFGWNGDEVAAGILNGASGRPKRRPIVTCVKQRSRAVILVAAFDPTSSTPPCVHALCVMGASTRSRVEVEERCLVCHWNNSASAQNSSRDAAEARVGDCCGVVIKEMAAMELQGHVMLAVKTSSRPPWPFGACNLRLCVVALATSEVTPGPWFIQDVDDSLTLHSSQTEGRVIGVERGALRVFTMSPPAMTAAPSAHRSNAASTSHVMAVSWRVSAVILWKDNGNQGAEHVLVAGCDGRLLYHCIDQKLGTSEVEVRGRLQHSWAWMCRLHAADQERSVAFLVGSLHGGCQLLVVEMEGGGRVVADAMECVELGHALSPVVAAAILDSEQAPTCPTIAIASGCGRDGQINILQRSLNLDIVQEVDIGLEDSDGAGASYGLLSCYCSELQGDVVVVSAGYGMPTAALLITREGTSSLDLPPLPRGERVVAVSCTASGLLIVVGSRGVQIVECAPELAVLGRTPTSALLQAKGEDGSTAPQVDHAMIVDDVIILSLGAKVVLARPDASGQVEVMAQAELPEPLSALTACTVSSAELVVAGGLFSRSAVVFLRFALKSRHSATKVTGPTVCQLDIAGVSDVSNVRALHLRGRPVGAVTKLDLIIGMGSGVVASAVMDVEKVDIAMPLTPTKSFRSGMCPVRLVPLADGSVYVNGSRDALLTLDLNSQECVECIPIHTADSRRTVVPLLSVAHDKRPAVAWLDKDGTLCMGQLDDSLTSHLHSRALHQQPVFLRHCPKLRAIVVVTQAQEESSGSLQSCVRLFMADSAVELTAPLRLRLGEKVSAVTCVGPLPDDDGHMSPRDCAASATELSDHRLRRNPGTNKTFLALASYSYDSNARVGPTVAAAAAPCNSTILLLDVQTTDTRDVESLPPVSTAGVPCMQLLPVCALPVPKDGRSACSFLEASSYCADPTLVAAGDDHLHILRLKCAAGGERLLRCLYTTRTPHRGAVTAMRVLRLSDAPRAPDEVTADSTSEERVIVSEFMGGVLVYRLMATTGELQLIAQNVVSCPTASMLSGLRSCWWRSSCGPSSRTSGIVAFDAYKMELLMLGWDDDCDEKSGREVVVVARSQVQEAIVAILTITNDKAGFITVGGAGMVHHYFPSTLGGRGLYVDQETVTFDV